MNDCDLEKRDGWYVCRNCGWGYGIMDETYNRNCPARPFEPLPEIGPGTELKRLLRRFGIHERIACKCVRRAKRMDIAGPDWCAENLEMIVDWLHEEARARRLPFVRALARVLVKRAIRNARRKLELLK